jgi:hypothetical protein
MKTKKWVGFTKSIVEKYNGNIAAPKNEPVD